MGNRRIQGMGRIGITYFNANLFAAGKVFWPPTTNEIMESNKRKKFLHPLAQQTPDNVRRSVLRDGAGNRGIYTQQPL